VNSKILLKMDIDNPKQSLDLHISHVLLRRTENLPIVPLFQQIITDKRTIGGEGSFYSRKISDIQVENSLHCNLVDVPVRVLCCRQWKPSMIPCTENE
jgi:hypothetical protein